MNVRSGQGTSTSVVDEEDVPETKSSEHPDGYCGVPGCWCHTDVDYHASYTGFHEASADEVACANTFFGF